MKKKYDPKGSNSVRWGLKIHTKSAYIAYFRRNKQKNATSDEPKFMKIGVLGHLLPHKKMKIFSIPSEIFLGVKNDRKIPIFFHFWPFLVIFYWKSLSVWLKGLILVRLDLIPLVDIQRAPKKLFRGVWTVRGVKNDHFLPKKCNFWAFY